MSSPQQQPPQSPPPSDDDHLVAAVAGILIVGAGLSITAAGIARVTRLPLDAVTGALTAVGADTVPMARPGLSQTAVTATKAANRMFRAAFVLNASRRISSGMKQGQDLKTLIGKERANWALHRKANARRIIVAKGVDLVGTSMGLPTPNGHLIGWYATVDGRTDGTCLAANGTNFYAEVPPMIGYPGATHMHCRCRPGPPHADGKMTYNVSAVRRGPDSTRFYSGGLR